MNYGSEDLVSHSKQITVLERLRALKLDLL